MVAKHDGIVLKSNKQFMWFSWKNLISAYHLYGKPRISGKNSKETVHPLGIFRVKRYYLPRYMFHLFYRFYRNDQNFLYHWCELPVPPGFLLARKPEEFTGIL